MQRPPPPTRGPDLFVRERAEARGACTKLAVPRAGVCPVTCDVLASVPHSQGGDVYAIWADFGYENEESLAAIMSDAQSGGFDYIVHAG